MRLGALSCVLTRYSGVPMLAGIMLHSVGAMPRHRVMANDTAGESAM
jgi:hypothetical protein